MYTGYRKTRQLDKRKLGDASTITIYNYKIDLTNKHDSKSTGCKRINDVTIIVPKYLQCGFKIDIMGIIITILKL